MHIQALDGRPQKHLAFLMSTSGAPKKRFAIAHENSLNGGMRFGPRLTLKIDRTGREGQLTA